MAEHVSLSRDLDKTKTDFGPLSESTARTITISITYDIPQDTRMESWNSSGSHRAVASSFCGDAVKAPGGFEIIESTLHVEKMTAVEFPRHRSCWKWGPHEFFLGPYFHVVSDVSIVPAAFPNFICPLNFFIFFMSLSLIFKNYISLQVLIIVSICISFAFLFMNN